MRLIELSLILCAKLAEISGWIGRHAIWVMPIMAAVTFLVVVMRYGFSIGSIKMQESVLYMQAALFMLTAAYCQRLNKHVRIDIFYGNRTPKQQAFINLCGSLFFLLPISVCMFAISWEYVATSWSYFEESREPGGLPFVYLLKTLLLIMPAMLFFQSIADARQYYLTLRATQTLK